MPRTEGRLPREPMDMTLVAERRLVVLRYGLQAVESYAVHVFTEAAAFGVELIRVSH